MSRKRKPHDRMRTPAEIVEILSKVKPVKPHEEGLFEIYSDKHASPPMSAMVVREFAASVVTSGLAYSSQDLYYLLKYSTGIDDSLIKLCGKKLARRPGGDVVGLGESLGQLWRANMVRRFCSGFMNKSAGGRPLTVRWMIKW